MIPLGALACVLTPACSLPLAVPVVALPESSTVTETLPAMKALSALWEEGVVLRVTCPHLLDGSDQEHSQVCPRPGVFLGPPREPLLGLCTRVLSIHQLKHTMSVFLNKWVSKSSDGGDEPVDCSEQCRHSVTAWVWLCVFSRK